MQDKLINQLKNLRRKTSLGIVHRQGDFFAFIGVGSHSRQNLFPCLHYLGIPVKYIYSRDAEVAGMAAQRFPGCQPCTNIETILTDDAVKAVFICTKPSLHFQYAMAALKAGKYVFLEKPPCFSMSELKQLDETGGTKCLIAFQKRYGIVNEYLKKSANALSYNYQYLTGSYPEGDALYELFSHAVDNIVFLFGSVSRINILSRTGGHNISYAINILHESGVIGNVELSTAYSWKSFTDKISINYPDKTATATYPGEIIIRKKKGGVFSIPAEKIFSRKPEYIELLNVNNGAPVLEQNPVYLHGYYNELREFIKLVSGSANANKSAALMLLETWRVLDYIKQKTTEV